MGKKIASEQKEKRLTWIQTKIFLKNQVDKKLDVQWVLKLSNYSSLLIRLFFDGEKVILILSKGIE